MHRIAVAGYLGNQLFQWAFGHSLQNQSSSLFLMQEMNIPTNGWRCELDFLSTSCKHFKIQKPIRSDLYRDKLLGKSDLVFSSLKSKKYFMSLSESILGISREHVSLHKRTISHRSNLYYGYFQNISLFRDYLPDLAAELSNAVIKRIEKMGSENSELNRINKTLEKVPCFQLVHVRRGDFLHPENRGFGLLSPDYYLANREDAPVVVITDDIEGSKDVIGQLQPILVVDPNKLDAISTLSLFMRPQVVVSSNSTFSYWVSLIALSMAKRVIIPSQFRPFEEDLSRFYVDGMEVSEARFVS
jgi:hypothetical protein